MFDAFIIGGGVAGMQCALILGSAHAKPVTRDKKIALLFHQKNSQLQSALLNNALGIAPGTTGAKLMETGKEQLIALYPHITLLEGEKALALTGKAGNFTITTQTTSYTAAIVVVAVGHTKFFTIEGLTQYIEPHAETDPAKERIQLRNTRHLVTKGIYVAGTLAGWRSQFAIAAGSGAQVATDILTLWNGGAHTHVHDSVA
jgi:thioredoxin reductase